MPEIVFRLNPLAPFRLDFTVWALRRRPNNEIDRWDGAVYRRVLNIDNTAVNIAVRQTGPPDKPELTIMATGAGIGRDYELVLAGAITRMLGLDRDLEGFYAVARKDHRLEPLAQRFRGMKPPRFPSIFEALVNGFAGQQVTLIAALAVLNRFAGLCGASYSQGESRTHAFPLPAEAARISPADLARAGFSRQKSAFILRLAEFCSTGGQGDLDMLESVPNDAEVAAQLRKFHGVGRWTAEYAMLRGMGRLDVFPADDVGARNILQRWLSITDGLDYDAINRILEPWRPYRGLVYLHLLLNHLAGGGHLT
ncbi:MAG: DNA-3-methyladenine glycosylase family protein [Candidatus Binataceae bacterium]